MIQLTNGRLVLPLCLHWPKGASQADWQGELMCYLSDDNGATWRRGKTAQKGYDASGKRITTQEPGVVELKDGSVLMFIRASGGCQYLSYSKDGGDTWSAPMASNLKSPLSPASIKRLPSTGDLLLVWNDHSAIHPMDDAVLLGYCASGLALSRVTRVPISWLCLDGELPVAVKQEAQLFEGVAKGAITVKRSSI